MIEVVILCDDCGDEIARGATQAIATRFAFDTGARQIGTQMIGADCLVYRNEEWRRW